MNRRALVLTLAVLATACGSREGTRVPSKILRPDREASPSLPTGQSLTFVSERRGHAQVFDLSLDAGEPRQLTEVDGSAYVGPVGPAGDILVVTSHGHGDTAREQLHMLREGTLTPLSRRTRFVRNPTWLPDGRSVIYESDESGFRNLFIAAIGGSESRQLTRCDHGCFEPSVSPDGKRVAYASPDSGDGEIYTLDLATQHSQRVTWSRGTDRLPSWSPSGELLAFISSREGLPRVYLMAPNGSQPRLLRASVESDLTAERDLVWSPDGRFVALVAQRRGRSELRIVQVANGETVSAADGAWFDQSPAWAPSGELIAFSSNRGGNPDLFVMRPDGTGLRRVTTDGAADWLPRWRRQIHHRHTL